MCIIRVGGRMGWHDVVCNTKVKQICSLSEGYLSSNEADKMKKKVVTCLRVRRCVFACELACMLCVCYKKAKT